MSEGDAELRDLVSQTLENSGVLAKIRAELRANVFLVLEEHAAFQGRNLSLINKPLTDFLSTQEGMMIVSLFREFLEYFNLEFTASVFEPETQAGKNYEYFGRKKLAQDLKLNSGIKSPLIAQVLQESKICLPPASIIQKEFLVDSSSKKDKAKDDRINQEISNQALKTEIGTKPLVSNGIGKNNEHVGKDLSNTENKSHLTTTPPSSFQSHMKNSEHLKLDLNQTSPKPMGSVLSSLGALPPLGLSQNPQPSKPQHNRSAKLVSSDIKALLDLGSESPENNYEEDFHASGSEKTSKGTNRSLSGSGSEVEEEMSVGMDDTSEHSGSNGSGKSTNYL